MYHQILIVVPIILIKCCIEARGSWSIHCACFEAQKAVNQGGRL